MTFSIAARCQRTDMLGVAVSTAVPAVGAMCPFVAPRVGAIATQSWVNPYLGIDGLALLSKGLNASQALERLLSDDPGREVRQVGIVDREGRSAGFTGGDNTEWAGHFTGLDFAIQGNMLTGERTLTEMVSSFEASESEELPERLVLALEAGQRGGGDKRGRQSAALRVFWAEDFPYMDLRVDEHRDPVAELRRVFEVAKRQLMPFVRMMPSRRDPIGGHDQRVVDFILLSPDERAARR